MYRFADHEADELRHSAAVKFFCEVTVVRIMLTTTQSSGVTLVELKPKHETPECEFGCSAVLRTIEILCGSGMWTNAAVNEYQKLPKDSKAREDIKTSGLHKRAYEFIHKLHFHSPV